MKSHITSKSKARTSSEMKEFYFIRIEPVSMTCSVLSTSALAKATGLFLILYEKMTRSTCPSLADECLRARKLRQLILDARHIVDAARPLACMLELLSGVCAPSAAHSLLYDTNRMAPYTWKT